MSQKKRIERKEQPKESKMRTRFLTTFLLILLISAVAIAQNQIIGGGMEDESEWEVYYYNQDFQPEYEFGYTEDTPKFGQGPCLHVWSDGTTGAQLLFWQSVTLVAGERYRATGAIKIINIDSPDETTPGSGPGSWFQYYIHEEVPQDPNDAGDYNPGGKIFDISAWKPNYTTSPRDGFWEDLTDDPDGDRADSPYFIPEGAPGEAVEVTVGIKFGHWWPSGGSFEILVDNIGLYSVEDNLVQGGSMDDEGAWEMIIYSDSQQPEFNFNYEDDAPLRGHGPCLQVITEEETGHAQGLLYQDVTLEAGYLYRMTGAVKLAEYVLPVDDPDAWTIGAGPGHWYQYYLHEESPDEAAGDFNPDGGIKLDMSAWKEHSQVIGDLDGYWEVYSDSVGSSPYFVPEGNPGDAVELTMGIKFGLWGPSAIGFFELLVDEVGLYRVSDDPVETAVSTEQNTLPQTMALSQNYPNPFNPETSITFELAQNESAKLTIYDLTGRKIAQLHDGVLGAGQHTVHWNSRDTAGNQVTSGVYLYRLETENNTLTKKLTLIR